MILLEWIGKGECCSCGAMALDVSLYEEINKDIYKKEYDKHTCCRMCAYKRPWLYSEQTRVLMETIIYSANVIRTDIK